MNSNKFYLCTFILSLLIIISCSTRDAVEQPDNRPNVILIMTDDKGYGDISAHGNPYLKTPNLDKLREESVRLTNFHVDPSCSPTRAAILTGQYSSRSGVWHTIGGRSLLREGKVTLAEVLQDAGYQTGYFGKWHLGENYPFRAMDRGFEETIVHGGGATSISPDYWGNKYFDSIFNHNGVFRQFKGYDGDVWFEQALKWIKNKKDEPFFAYISTNIPHAPLIIEETYAEPHRDMVSERLSNYYGMLVRFDENIGKFLQEIDDLQLTENTIVIYMTDNGPGPWFGGIILDDDQFVVEGYNAGMRGAKIRGYEGAHRVPFFIRWPAGGLEAGKDVDKLTAHFDMFPTLLDLTGIAKPDTVEFDGVSLTPLIKGTATDWTDRTLFVHNQRLQDAQKYKDYQVLTEQWRLIQLGDNDRELYDIRQDPGQKNDIADRHPEVVEALTLEYEEWWEDTSVDFHKYNSIVIGTEHENPAILYSHDALRSDDGMVWSVRVEEAGIYEFSLYRWPIESGRKIVENQGPTFRHSLTPTSDIHTDRFGIETSGSLTANIRGAHLAIGNQDRTAQVNETMTAATFTVHLKPGQTSLRAWFSEGSQNHRANYVKVERIGPSVTGDYNYEEGAYKPVHPDEILRQGR